MKSDAPIPSNRSVSSEMKVGEKPFDVQHRLQYKIESHVCVQGHLSVMNFIQQ